MPLSEADTSAKLIDPVLYARGWTEDLIQGEETAGAVEIVEMAAQALTGRCRILSQNQIIRRTLAC